MIKTFSIWRLVVLVGWAADWFWVSTSKAGERETHIVSLRVVRKGTDSGVALVIGPFRCMVGIA